MSGNKGGEASPSEADQALVAHWTAIRQREGGFEGLFGQLVDSIDQLAWMASGDGFIFWYNQRWYDYTGESLQSMRGWGWREVHHPAHVDRVLADVGVAWQRGVPFEMTFPLRARAGHYRWFLTRVVPIFDASGRLVNWFGTNTDIDVHKRAQDRLDELFAQAPVGILVLDGKDLCFSLANERARAILGCGPEVLGQPLTEVLPPAAGPEVHRLLAAVQRDRRPLEGRNLGIRVPDGTAGRRRIDVDILAHPRRGAASAGDGLIVVIVDVSARLSAERQTQRLTQDLEKAVAVRDEFLAIGSHELKTPLTSLKLQLEMRRRRLARGGPTPARDEVARALEADSHQVDRLVALVRDMLDIAKFRSGRLSVARVPVDVGRLTVEVVHRMADIFRQAGSPIALAVGEDLVAWGDRARLEQILLNLLTNALKYAGGTQVSVSVERQGARVVLVVADRGPGIAPEHQARIFGKFERAVGRSEVSGLGLGLFIVQQLVDAHGGELTLASARGAGAAFTVSLPAGVGADVCRAGPP